MGVVKYVGVWSSCILNIAHVHIFPTVALLSFEEQEYFLQEGGIIEVCLADVTEPLEAPITVQLSLVNATDIEGVQIIIPMQQYTKLLCLEIFYLLNHHPHCLVMKLSFYKGLPC